MRILVNNGQIEGRLGCVKSWVETSMHSALDPNDVCDFLLSEKLELSKHSENFQQRYNRLTTGIDTIDDSTLEARFLMELLLPSRWVHNQRSAVDNYVTFSVRS